MYRFATVLLATSLSGCLSSKLSHVHSAEGFDWDAMKRDQILMTPLQDWRAPQKTKGLHEEALKFFPEEARTQYPQRFKEAFFKLRKDIRVFGAGGAFENMSALDGLDAAGRLSVTGKPLPKETVDKILRGNQDIRFLMFFGLADESLDYTFKTSVSTSGCKLKTYGSVRYMEVRASLWDSQSNTTPWIGTKHLAPTHSFSKKVGLHAATIAKLKKKARKNGKRFKLPDCGRTEAGFRSATLASELRKNRDRFPAHPSREPAFSGSFQNFILSIPMGSSERNWIEYKHFTNHRIGLAYQAVQAQNETYTGGSFRFSSRKYNRYRLGLEVSGASRQEDLILTSLSSFGLLALSEFDLSDALQISFGAVMGRASLSVEDTSLEDLDMDQQAAADGAWFAHPTINVHWGNRRGGQIYLSYMKHFFRGFTEHANLAETIDEQYQVGLSYTFAGF